MEEKHIEEEFLDNDWEYDHTSDVANLSAAFGSLMELDSQLLSKVGQAKLAKMKRQVFNALVFYCDLLPVPDKSKNPETDAE